MIKPRWVRFLDKGTGVVDQVQYPCPEEWTTDQVAEDIEKDVPFVQVLQVSHNFIPGMLGKMVDADPKFAPEKEESKK